MTTWWICFMSLLTLLRGILRFFSPLNECLWIMSRTPTIMVKRG